MIFTCKLISHCIFQLTALKACSLENAFCDTGKCTNCGCGVNSENMTGEGMLKSPTQFYPTRFVFFSVECNIANVKLN